MRTSGRLIVGARHVDVAWVQLHRGLECAANVSLDVADVTAIDAWGVGRLLVLRERLAARKATLRLARVPARVQRVLTAVGLDTVLAPTSPDPVAAGTSVDVPPSPQLCGCA